MNSDDVRAYVTRDWARVGRLKSARWVDRRARYGPDDGFRVAAALYEHVRRTHPDWPSHQSRCADLEHHLALSESLRATARRR